MRNIQNESGRTMLEMLGVLAIMGVLMYGAIAGIGFGVETYKINATYNLLEELSQGVVDLYSWSPNYAHNIIDAVCRNKVVNCREGSMDASGHKTWTIEPLWSNVAINVQSADSGTRFAITHGGLSSLACSRLRDMAYAQMCVNREGNLCAGGEDIGNSCDNNCSDGECVLYLISR